ncbi:MAG: hypothetical protein JHD16_13175, partial [Solirubrobacteraceae bacterium]|nr:hypothetical protein [Solirubrobacteraceae bacterium]
MSPAPRPHGVQSLVRTALAAFALTASVTPVTAMAEVLPAPAASTYRDSVGVQTHLDFAGYAYAEEPIENLQTAIRELGVRHVRDHACLDTEAVCGTVRARLAQIGTGTFGPSGPRVGLMINVMPTANKPVLRADRDAAIRRALEGVRDTPLASLAEGLEMVNEPDLHVKTWAAQTVADAATMTRLLALPEFASLRDIPVLAPALGRQTKTAELAAAGWDPNVADVSNMHPYPAIWSVPEQGLETTCDEGRNIVDCAESLAPSDAAVATESGYSTAGSALTPDWLSQRAQAIYSLRVLLHNFKAGVPRTYLYELIDLKATPVDRNHGYGLLKARMGKDSFTARMAGPKVAYQAVSRMHSVIGDLGGAAKPGSLDVTVTDALSGAPVAEDQVERLVLRRADGSYVLALWQPEKSAAWKPEAWPRVDFDYKELIVAPKVLKVSLDGSQGSWSAKQYVPTLAEAPLLSWSGTSSMTLPVSDEITLLDLTPPAALREPAAPATPGPSTAPTPDVPGLTLPATPTADVITAPSSAAPRPVEESRTAAPAAQTPTRAQADVAREKANRRARAR